MITLRSFKAAVCLAVFVALLPSDARAEAADVPADVPGTASTSLPEVTADFLQSQIAETKAATDLGDDVKKSVIALYQSALAELDHAKSLEKQAADFKKATVTAADRLRAVREELDRPPEKPHSEL